jgi:hypothetical protein
MSDSEFSKTRGVPAAVRRALLIASNYSCVVDNVQWFVDIHHITSRAANGTHDPSNLVVLCPTCHRAAERGRIKPQELRTLKRQHEAAVRANRAVHSSISSLRGWQVYNYIQSHCLDRRFDRSRRLRRSTKSLYMIASDIGNAGVIVDPNDRAPLLVLHEELVSLSALEVVVTPERLILLARLELSDPTWTTELRLVSVDVLQFYSAAFDSNEVVVRAAIDGAIHLVDSWLSDVGLPVPQR